MAIELIVAVIVPGLLRVTICRSLVLPTTVAGKASEVTLNPSAPGATPVPVIETSCGVPVALSAIDSEAGSDPATVGLNSTEIVQLAAAASDVVQVVADFIYEVAPVPVNPIVPNVTADTLVFFTVTTCAAVVEPTVVEANVSAVGATVTVRAAATPVPVMATSCGVPVALSAMDNDAGSDPATVGLNSTEIVQLAAAASDVVQVVADFIYEVAPVPVNPIVPSVTADTLVFFTVTT
jgi:hypothetical protein